MKYFKHVSYIEPGKLLPAADKAGTFEFFGNDSKEAFTENLKKKGSNWYYANHKVQYTFNSNGYRAPEWNDIDWKESVVIFGGSDVLGVAVDDTDTLSAKLSKLIDRPVINLGVAGAGIIYAAQNAFLLHKQFPTPWAVVNIWSNPVRMHTYWKDAVQHFGSWSIEKGNFADRWFNPFTNPELHCYFAASMAKQLWVDKTRYYEATWWPETSYLLECKYFSKKDCDARDLAHYGIDSIQLAAEQITGNLK